MYLKINARSFYGTKDIVIERLISKIIPADFSSIYPETDILERKVERKVKAAAV